MPMKRKRASQAIAPRVPPSFAAGPPPMAGPAPQGQPMMKKGGMVRRKKAKRK